MSEDKIDWVGERVVAEITGRSVRTIQFWRWNKCGPPYHKVEGAVRYNKAEVLAWWNAGRVAA